MARQPRTYRLTEQLAAQNAGGPVLCLADSAIGSTFRLHAERPRYVRSRDLLAGIDPDTGRPVYNARADLVRADGDKGAAVAHVAIAGPIEQRAGYHDPCGGWSDGYDAIAERLTQALSDADVLLTVDSPGGAVAGIRECVDRVLAAKAQHGRRITVRVEGMAASAGYWLSAAIADKGEIHLTAGSMVGSIGARAAHVSEAGALAKEGLEVTDFAYPAGKVALSPNRKLSATGRARGERDVMLAFEAFASAVSAARPQLTRKAIVKLDADMLTGAAAVAAGLADSVASTEDVETWALVRAAGEDMPDDEKPEDDKPAAEDMPEKCGKCEASMSTDAAYCAKCGAKATAEEEMPEDDEEEAPPEDAAARAQSGSTVATMLGLRAGASDIAIKAALAPVLAFHRHVLSALGADNIGAAKGKLRALAEDARLGVKAARDLKTERATAEKAERIDLLKRLADADLPGFARGDLLIDEVNDDGRVTGLKAAPVFASTPIKELRGFVSGKLDNAGPAAPPRERNPFEPKPLAANGEPRVTAADIATAQRFGMDPKDIAASRTALNLNGAPRANTGA